MPESLEEVENLASQGLTEAQIADALGIHRVTLIERKKDYSDFADAIKRGKARGIATVTNSLMQQIMEGNTAAAIFYLKARAGWSDKPEEKETTADKARAIVDAIRAIDDLDDPHS